jgi:chromosome segregation ATPase
MKFYKSFTEDRIIVTTEPIKDHGFQEREIHPRDLPSTGILGTAYDAGFSDGVEMGADGWQAAREQLVEERDKAIRASPHIAENLAKEKQAHLTTILQRNSCRKELEREVERANRIALMRDSLAKELYAVKREQYSVNGPYGLLNKQLARVSAELAEHNKRNSTQSKTIDALTMERNRLQETVDELREQIANRVCPEYHKAVLNQLDQAFADRNRFQKMLGELQERLNKCVDGAYHDDLVKKLRDQLNKVVAERDNFEKQLRDELSNVYSGGKAYAEGLSNGKGYAYTEISNHCRELRSKLKGEY